MGIRKIRGVVAASLAAMLLVGCASKEPEDEGVGMDPSAQAPTTSTEVDQGPVEAVTESVKPTVVRNKIVIPPMDSGMSGETLQGMFYFDFDQAIVKRAGHTELNKHAEVLSGDRMLRVRLEGHADERGTREYNLALG